MFRYILRLVTIHASPADGIPTKGLGPVLTLEPEGFVSAEVTMAYFSEKHFAPMKNFPSQKNFKKLPQDISEITLANWSYFFEDNEAFLKKSMKNLNVA